MPLLNVRHWHCSTKHIWLTLTHQARTLWEETKGAEYLACPRKQTVEGGWWVASWPMTVWQYYPPYPPWVSGGWMEEKLSLRNSIKRKYMKENLQVNVGYISSLWVQKGVKKLIFFLGLVWGTLTHSGLVFKSDQGTHSLYSSWAFAPLLSLLSSGGERGVHKGIALFLAVINERPQLLSITMTVV